MGAGEDEIVDPPSLADWWKRQSMILVLWMRDGLIERRCRRDESGPYYLTAKARAYLKPPNVGANRAAEGGPVERPVVPLHPKRRRT